jgi:regulatory protein
MAIDKKILNRLQRFCVYRERCCKEVYQKLHSLHVTHADAGLYIELLKKQGFLNEKRFALTYAHDKFRLNKWGRIKIATHLKEYQVDHDLIQLALNSIDNEEYRTVIIQLAERYQASLKSDMAPAAKRQRLLQYLYGKGFEPAIVADIISAF